MKYLLAILALLHFSFSHSQKNAETLIDKANEYSYAKDKHTEALKSYRKLQRRFPQYRTGYVLYKTGDILLKLGDTSKAEYYFLESMKIDFKHDSIDFGYGQSMSSRSVADLYFIQNKYKEAIQYLNLSREEFKIQKVYCSAGTRVSEDLYFYFKKAICYNGLNKKDSAIITLAPFVFRPKNYYDVDTANYRSMYIYLVSDLFTYYGKSESKKELENALNNISYTVSYKEYPDSKTKWASAKCYISFFGIKITLDSNSAVGLGIDQQTPYMISKEYFLREFTKSEAYKMIMD